MSFTPRPDHAARIARARLALDGLSIGDAFGERFFGPDQYVLPLLRHRELRSGRWRWTDDTAMALSVFETLDRFGGVDPRNLNGGASLRASRGFTGPSGAAWAKLVCP